MRELKAYSPYANRYRDVLLYHNGDTDLILDDEDKVYLKEDVDALLAEKDKMLARHKYKRCLAMAWWCETRHFVIRYLQAEKILNDENYIGTFDYIRREYMIKHYYRWANKWLELAEKFKDSEH